MRYLTTLRNIYRHVQRFGLPHGVHVWNRLRGPDGAPGKARIFVPELGRAVTLRMPTQDRAIFRQIYVHREYDFALPVAPTHILDGGANIGLASLYFAARYPEARILAVEPVASNLAVLRQNTADAPTVEVIAGALWSEPTTLEIADPHAPSSAFQMRAAPGEAAAAPETAVPAYTVGDLLASMPSDARIFVKLDIEGAEREVFGGDASWMDRITALAVELHDRFAPGCTEALEKAAAGRGFRRFTHGEYTVLVRDAPPPR